MNWEYDPKGILVPGAKSLAEQSPVEVPLYTFPDAARYLHVPVGWVALFVSDRPLDIPYDLPARFRHDERSRALFADDAGPFLRDGKPARISFRSLASLFVATAVVRPLFSDIPFISWHPVEFTRDFETAHDLTQRLPDDPRLLIDPEWVASEYLRGDDPASEADRARLGKWIALHQSRLVLEDGTPTRLFPFSRDPAADAPRSVVIDPAVRFGRPTVGGAPTDVLAERWRAGDAATDLAEDYGLTTGEVEEALRYEATPYHRLPFFAVPWPGW